jgi:hypothetical protein
VAHDLGKVHECYQDEIVVEFPQSGQRIRGKQNIYELRTQSRSLLNANLEDYLRLFNEYLPRLILGIKNINYNEIGMDSDVINKDSK